MSSLKYKLLLLISPYPYRRYTGRHNCVFVHIPKTAGTSVLLKLTKKTISRDHCSYREYLTADIKKFNKYFKFSFVRNPYDRLVSVYHYLKSGGNGSPGDLYYSKIINNHQEDFSAFVSTFLNEYTIHEHLLFKPQYLFVCDHTGKLMVDYIGYFETLNSDFSYISRKIGISGTLKKTNPSSRGPWINYYKNQNIGDKIYKLYKKDFEIFKYQHQEFGQASAKSEFTKALEP